MSPVRPHDPKNKGKGRYALLGLVLMLPFAAWNGFVIKVLWDWFVVPLHVVAIPNVWDAAGIYLLVQLCTVRPEMVQHAESTDVRSPLEKFIYETVTHVLLPALALGIGALYHAFG